MWFGREVLLCLLHLKVFMGVYLLVSIAFLYLLLAISNGPSWVVFPSFVVLRLREEYILKVYSLSIAVNRSTIDW